MTSSNAGIPSPGGATTRVIPLPAERDNHPVFVVDPSRVAERIDILLLTALFEEREVLKLNLESVFESALRELNKSLSSNDKYSLEPLPPNLVDVAYSLERWALVRQTNGVSVERPLTLGIATLPQMGNVFAGLYTNHYIRHHSPRLIFLLGICGSADTGVLDLGDVLISTEVHWSNVHKLRPSTSVELAAKHPELALYEVWDRAQYRTPGEWVGILRKFFDRKSRDLPSNWDAAPFSKPLIDHARADQDQKVAFGPLVATNHVVDHPAIRDKHKKEAKAFGIEMESAGVFAAIDLHNEVNVEPKPPKVVGFAFKGVSDRCAEKGDNIWRQIAGHNAAYAALSFIFFNLPLIERQLEEADRLAGGLRRTRSGHPPRGLTGRRS